MGSACTPSRSIARQAGRGKHLTTVGACANPSDLLDVINIKPHCIIKHHGMIYLDAH